jgi:hypothetical protein
MSRSIASGRTARSNAGIAYGRTTADVRDVWRPNWEANLIAWYQADAGVSVDGSNNVSQLNDQSGNGHHLTQATASRRPNANEVSNAGNWVKWSDDITQVTPGGWASSNVTNQSASLFTVTANSGRCFVYIPTQQGKRYRLSFKARRVTGNATVVFWTNGSGSGNTQPLTIDGTLTQYSVEILGARSGITNGTVEMGLADAGAGGTKGQLEITNMSVQESYWDSTFVATSGRVKRPALANGKQFLFTDLDAPTSQPLLGPVVYTLVQPCTLYLAMGWNDYATGQYFCDGGTNNSAGIAQTSSNPGVALRPDAAPAVDTVPVEPFIVTAIWNSASSKIQFNYGTPVTGGTAGGNPGGFSLFNRVDHTRARCMDFYEAIIRSGADSTATIKMHLDYLRNRWGFSLR